MEIYERDWIKASCYKKGGSIGSPDHDIMVKPSRANTCPKKMQSRKDTDRITVLEYEYGCES